MFDSLNAVIYGILSNHCTYNIIYSATNSNGTPQTSFNIIIIFKHYLKLPNNIIVDFKYYQWFIRFIHISVY